MSDYDQQRGAARENLCRYLAACFYQPGPEYAEEKVFESMLDAAARVDAELAACARRLDGAFADEGVDKLLVDYTRLFLGPAHILAKPYGSAWLEGEQTLMQDSTADVDALYAEGGFEIDDGFRELPDHIAAELEFLYLLIFRENEAQRSGDAAALAAIADLRKRFLGDHLGAWIVPFAAAVRDGAETDFYRELAELTGRFVSMEAAPAQR